MKKLKIIGWFSLDILGLIGLFAVYMFSRVTKVFSWWTAVLKFKYWRHSAFQIKQDMTRMFIILIPATIFYFFGIFWLVISLALYALTAIGGLIYIKWIQTDKDYV